MPFPKSFDPLTLSFHIGAPHLRGHGQWNALMARLVLEIDQGDGMGWMLVGMTTGHILFVLLMTKSHK